MGGTRKRKISPGVRGNGKKVQTGNRATQAQGGSQGGNQPVQSQNQAQTPAQSTQANAPETDKQSLTVDGTKYSPISLKKIIESGMLDTEPGEKSREFTIFIPGTNEQLGFAADDPNVVNILIKDRVMQAEYFIDEIYAKLPRIPAYLYRYIHYMMFSEEYEPKYKSDNDYLMALESGILKKEDEEYQQIHNFIKWGKSNSEAVHLIGMAQLVGGTLKSFAKKGSGCRLYIEFPETGFHPKRERKIMLLLNHIKDDYGIREDWTPTK